MSRVKATEDPMFSPQEPLEKPHEVIVRSDGCQIDKNIYPLVRWMNEQKGIKTYFSCEGSHDPRLGQNGRSYVMFASTTHGLHILLDKLEKHLGASEHDMYKVVVTRWPQVMVGKGNRRSLRYQLLFKNKIVMMVFVAILQKKIRLGSSIILKMEQEGVLKKNLQMI